MAITAGELGDLYLALFSSFFEDEVRKCVYFRDISYMSNLSYSKLSSEVASEGIHFKGMAYFILCDEN